MVCANYLSLIPAIAATSLSEPLANTGRLAGSSKKAATSASEKSCYTNNA